MPCRSDWMEPTVKEATTALADLRGKLEAAEGENTRLRAALANSDQPCAYCSLPKDEWAKCQHGFPGCDRADDAMGCPELGASLDLSRIRALLVEAGEGLYHARNQIQHPDQFLDETIARIEQEKATWPT